jgi:hypothetical protein
VHANFWSLVVMYKFKTRVYTVSIITFSVREFNRQDAPSKNMQPFARIHDIRKEEKNIAFVICKQW